MNHPSAAINVIKSRPLSWMRISLE
jgi:hypothetical protein